MNFAEAVMVFVNSFCAQRKDDGKPVYLSEMANGLTLVVLAMLASIKDERDRAVVRAAIIDALGDDTVADKQALN
jgi:hypothetical protein